RVLGAGLGALPREEPHLRLWDITGKVRVLYRAKGSEEISQPIYSPDGRFLTAVIAGQVRRWDVKSGRLVKTVELKSDAGAVLSPDGNTAAFVYGDDQVWLHNVIRGKKRRLKPAKPDYWFPRLTFSGNGRTLLVFDMVRGIDLWDVATGRRIRRLGIPPGTGEVSALELSPDRRPLYACEMWGLIPALAVPTGQSRSPPAAPAAPPPPPA